MAMSTPKLLNDYLALNYPFNVVADPDGGYVVIFPDLPGCMTQAETLGEVGTLAEEIRSLWLETAYEQGLEIPLPSYPETEYSGKFNVRLPRSLHRSLAEAAEHEGVSLNQYVVGVLSRGDTQARVEHRLDALEDRIRSFQEPFIPDAVMAGHLSNPPSPEAFRHIWYTYSERLSRDRPVFKEWFSAPRTMYEPVAFYSFCKSYTTFFEFLPAYTPITASQPADRRLKMKRSQDGIHIVVKWLNRYVQSRELVAEGEQAHSE